MIIEPSAESLLEENVLKILEFHRAESLISDHRVSISGMPLHIYDGSNELHFSDCGYLQSHRVQVTRVGTGRVPIVGHRHIAQEYISEDDYPIINCIDVDKRIIVFGVREALGFEIYL